jgi:hypothetical protein
MSLRAAPKATSRSNSRRATRSVIGAARAASAGETQSSASRRSTILGSALRELLAPTELHHQAGRDPSSVVAIVLAESFLSQSNQRLSDST